MSRARRNKHKTPRPRLDDVLQAVAPPVSGGAFQHVKDCFLIAVVVCTGRCAGHHRAEECAQYFGVGVAAVESDLTEQSRRLRSRIGKFAMPDDAHRRLVHRGSLSFVTDAPRLFSSTPSGPTTPRGGHPAA